MQRQVTSLAAGILVLGLVLLGVNPNAASAAESPVAQTPQQIRASRRTVLNVDGVPYGVDVEIATGAAGDEDLLRGVYVFRLKCSADLVCSFQRLALNECSSKLDREPTFSPVFDIWMTSSRLLTLKQLSNTELELRLYQAFGNQLPARVTLTFSSEGTPFKKVVGFRTDGFVDFRFWPDTKTGIEYVPIKHARQKRLDCPMLLRGLTP